MKLCYYVSLSLIWELLLCVGLSTQYARSFCYEYANLDEESQKRLSTNNLFAMFYEERARKSL